MKKCLLFVLLASSLTSLVGCQKSDPIKKISIKGSLTKKVYKYDDSWDLSGLSVYADFESGSSRALESNEYDFHFNAEAPKNFATALSITAVYKKDTSKTATFAAKDIKVADEVYDEEKEIDKDKNPITKLTGMVIQLLHAERITIDKQSHPRRHHIHQY